MLSYKIPAAISLLHSKLEAAEMSMRNTVEDLEFLREQITMMEVNTARVYNWDVKRRREKRERPMGDLDWNILTPRQTDSTNIEADNTSLMS